jgi:hypothetical protein
MKEEEEKEKMEEIMKKGKIEAGSKKNRKWSKRKT